jgi:hypothetical protein
VSENITEFNLLLISQIHLRKDGNFGPVLGFFLVALCFELRASGLLGKPSANLSHNPSLTASFFCDPDSLFNFLLFIIA